MVAFHYPPEHSSSGVLRTLKFSKYLPETGWQPYVLTVKEQYYERTDPALLAQTPPHASIFRTRAINTKDAFSVRGKYLRLFTVPDRFIGWLPFAVAAGLRIIRRHNINALYSTSPLGTSHLIASVLKTWTRLPWLADFRDPWVEPQLQTNPWAPLYRLECLLERSVIRKADRLVFTTAQLREEIGARYGKTARNKAVVIPNGYDESDFSDVPELTPPASPIQVTHTGLVDSSYRSPRPFLEGLARLVERGEIPLNQIRVEFIGDSPYLYSSDFREMVARLGLSGVVDLVGRVSYAESIARQARSHVLLLLQCGSDTRTLIPAKAFEYLRVGRPILAIVPPSASAELFAEVGGAEVVDPEDPEGIEEAFRVLFAAARAGHWKSSLRLGSLKKYSRRALTIRLAEELDTLIVK
jgi:glycosyltransferase involved in cell wall biosynthesis